MVLVEMVKSEFIVPIIHLCSPISSLKIKDNEKEIHHRRNEERGQGVGAPQIWSKIGQIKSKIGEKRTKMEPFGVLSFMKILLVCPSLNQK